MIKIKTVTPLGSTTSVNIKDVAEDYFVKLIQMYAFCRHIGKLNHYFHNNLQYQDYRHLRYSLEVYTKLLEL